MTMPHLMNCPHSDDSWCLDCVKEKYDEIERLRDVLAEIHDWAQYAAEYGDVLGQRISKAAASALDEPNAPDHPQNRREESHE